MSRPARILIAAGGTGGHVYPAIAVADAVKRKEPASALAFAGTTDRIEWEAVPRAGYPIYPITAAALNRADKLANLRVPGRLAKGLYQSYRLVHEFDADLVFGAGGFVAGPVGVAAWMGKRPLVLQEQNAYAGVTNRLLGRLAEQVHIAFPEATEAFPEGRVLLSGNPTRSALKGVQQSPARRRMGIPEDARVLLVFGGSLGSQALNEALMETVHLFLEGTDAHLIWQTGRRYHERVRAAIAPTDRLHILEYLHDMPAAYACADLAMCRAGASTCAELLVTGTPAILVPSPNVAEDHQTHNARSVVAAGAARILPEPQLVSEWVAMASSLLDDRDAREAMRSAARRHAVEDAAERIATSLLDLAGRRAAA
ncbi:MAG: undecaprenyldiphospho-muramoylpentapeptide beta-N-acetylglucosaminyltransferase [Rhodothermales bacterium]|nr:undecaprenyldiphospho-muramoylpentapeptide beta-N-acetylglucosaminyltransferase [Rhodothermales bacterium]MBO6778880.1 undecaprenyldiphospho-muramoylpentapeptide beta-N-acetylglucosaminyltransferase [Rhodothermales bacterium]